MCLSYHLVFGCGCIIVRYDNITPVSQSMNCKRAGGWAAYERYFSAAIPYKSRGTCSLCHSLRAGSRRGTTDITAPHPATPNPSGTLNPVSLLAHDRSLHTDKWGQQDQHALQPVSNQYSLQPWIIHTIRKPLTPKPNELNAHLILFYYSQLRGE